ncbi:hypothetical protein NUACC21_05070 [Scytonema sp. NUACC21]
MSERMPEEFWQGVEQFNTGQYYDCHDTLEALWIEATEPEKTFYQGILQIAVALYHLGNKNLRGAAILLGEGSNRLRRYPSDYGGIDVDELLDESAALLKALQQTEPEKIAAFKLGQDETLALPKIIRVNSEKD